MPCARGNAGSLRNPLRTEQPVPSSMLQARADDVPGEALKSLARCPMPSIGHSVTQDLATGINGLGNCQKALDRAGLKKETGQGAGVGPCCCGLFSAVIRKADRRWLPIPVPLEEVWVRSVLLSLEGDVCCGAWCTWIAWTGTC